VKHDFPCDWPELNSWLLETLAQVNSSLEQLVSESPAHLKRFFSLYLDVMKMQDSKKHSIRKGAFYKVAMAHCQAAYQVWEKFDKAMRCFFSEHGQLTLERFNESVFYLGMMADRCLSIVVACSFNLSDLVSNPTDNTYV